MISIPTYVAYFSLEIKEYIDKNGIDKEKYNLSNLHIIEETDISDFKEKRLNGENDNFICEYIRKDLIDEFITYVKKNDYSVNNTIPKSDFETNPLLLDQFKITLIEYAAFFGSNQIFKYLFQNGADLTESLWIYAIHGEDPEIINILIEKEIKFTEEEEENDEINEDNDDGDEDSKSEYEGTDVEDFDSEIESPIKFDIKLKKNITYKRCLIECIKCHSYDVFKYIEQNFTSEENKDMISYGFRFYNFLYINDNYINDHFFYYACKYDYYTIVKFLLEMHKIDINKKIIL